MSLSSSSSKPNFEALLAVVEDYSKEKEQEEQHKEEEEQKQKIILQQQQQQHLLSLKRNRSSEGFNESGNFTLEKQVIEILFFHLLNLLI